MAVLNIYHHELVLANLELPINRIIKSVLFYIQLLSLMLTFTHVLCVSSSFPCNVYYLVVLIYHNLLFHISVEYISVVLRFGYYEQSCYKYPCAVFVWI